MDQGGTTSDRIDTGAFHFDDGPFTSFTCHAHLLDSELSSPLTRVSFAEHQGGTSRERPSENDLAKAYEVHLHIQAAQQYVVAMADLRRILGNLRDAPSIVADKIEKFDTEFPALRDARDSLVHIGDRARG